MDNADMKELASQLRQPTGEKGIEVAEMMHETNIAMTLHSIDRLQVSEGNTILELGHGNCEHLPHLLEQKRNISYYGLEVSDLMNKEAQRINKTFVDKNRASFHLYDGLSIPFAEHYFDRVFTVNTLYFWEDPTHLLSELYRVIKPNGILNITFAQSKFMEQLPFIQFGFNLYDTKKITQLINTTLFKIIGLDTRSETIKSKTGESVNREFTTVTIQK